MLNIIDTLEDLDEDNHDDDHESWSKEKVSTVASEMEVQKKKWN